VEVLVRRRRIVMAGFVALALAIGALFVRMPTGFLPEEDQGQLMVSVMLPPGSTAERTREVMERVDEYFLETESEAVESMLTISGFSFSGRGQNAGLAFVRLRDWDERQADRASAHAVAARATAEFSTWKEAVVFA